MLKWILYYTKINHEYSTRIKYSEKLRPKTSLHGFKSNAMLCVNNVLIMCWEDAIRNWEKLLLQEYN